MIRRKAIAEMTKECSDMQKAMRGRETEVEKPW